MVADNTQNTQQGLIKGLDHPIRLSVFEGPLDLMLFLIRKSEIDIYDIPIESVTRQYLDILFGMEKLNLEVAGEFFVMAATLMHIKSRMLLPKNEQILQGDEDEEDFDPRWELVQQLIEYKKFKEAASSLETMSEEAGNRLPRLYKAAKEDLPEKPLRNSDRIELWNVYNQVLRRLAEKLIVGEIHDESVTIADRMEFILDILETRREFSFSSLFPEDEEHSLVKIIATFIALLELTRLKRLDLQQDEHFSEIHCLALDDAPEPPPVAPEDPDYQELAPDEAIEQTDIANPSE